MDPATAILIRPYAAADAGATLDIFLRAVGETASADYSPEQINAWARPAHRNQDAWNDSRAATETRVAVIGGAVVGFSDVSAEGYINMMFVIPDAGRQGVASALLAAVSDVARSTGVQELSTDASTTALPFFTRHGFHVVAEQHPEIDGVQLTNFRMTKRLLQA